MLWHFWEMERRFYTLTIIRGGRLCRLLNDLPIRIFLDNPAFSKLPVVASAHPNPTPIWPRAGQKPFGYTHVTTDPVSIITVMDVWEALEACRYPLTHSRFAYKALSLGFWPAGQV